MPPSHDPPSPLGPFELLAPLGEGATALVHRARAVEDLGALPPGLEFALKVARVVSDQPAANERLHREARLGRRVGHPGLAAVLGHGELQQDGRAHAWVAFELVEGRSLRALLDQLGAVPEALLRAIAAPLGRSLAALHEAGVVHRDLKPENVVVTEAHEVKLLDLGLALDRQLPASGDERFAGTPAYAAPEVLASEPATPASDRHSLGVLLFEAAAGERPFDPGGVERGPRLQAPALGGVAPQVSAWLEEVVATLLDPAPEARFASSEELARVLEEAEGSEWWRGRERALAGSPESRAWWPDRPPAGAGLVGRTGELARLREAFERAAGGRGGLLLLEGEAGLGKTRLLQELVAGLESEGARFVGLHGQGAPVASALARSLRRRFGAAGLRPALRRLVPGGPELRAALAAWALEGEVPGARGGEAEGAIDAGLRRLLDGLAREAPVLWLLEDLHAASAEDLARLARLAAGLQSRPVLLLATTRPGREDVGRLPGERLGLEPLDEAAVRELLLEQGLHESAAEELAGGPSAAATRNPLFALRLVDELEAEGAWKCGADGRLRLGPQARSLVPGTLAELLGARLALLDEADRELLATAAVEGEDFEPAILAATLSRSELEVLERLGALERRARLVQSVGAAHRFVHPLLRETLRDGLAEGARRERHLALSEAWRQRAEEPPVRAVAHALRAGRPERVDEQVVPALTALDRACRHEELLALAGLALEQAGADAPARRSELLKLRANALALTGRDDERAVALEEALHEAERAGDEALARVRRHDLALLRFEQGRGDEARELATRAAADARAADDAVVLEKSLAVLARVASREGRPEEALEHAGELVESGRRRGDRDAEAQGHALAGVALHRLGRLDEARERAEAQLARWRETGDRFREAYALEALGAVLNDLGDRGAACEAHEQARRLCAELGHSVGESGAGMSLANDLLNLGDFARAREVAEESLAAARSIGRPDLECGLLINAGVARLELGDLDGAESDLEAARAQAAERSWTPWAAYAQSTLGRVAEWRGDDALARERHAAALAALRPLGLDAETGRAALGLALVLLRTGERDEAVALLEEARSLLGEGRLDLDGATPEVGLALAGEIEPREVTVPRGLPARSRAECHLLLFEAGGGARHLNRAWNLVEEMSARLPTAERARFRERNPVVRRVLASAT